MDKPSPNAVEGDEPYVFVSYSHADERTVRREIRWLQSRGINVWYDEGIVPGSEWSDALARAIRGCSHFVCFVTPRSVATENCRRELNFAIEEHRPVLAVYLEETEVPDGIRPNLINRIVDARWPYTIGLLKSAPYLEEYRGDPRYEDAMKRLRAIESQGTRIRLQRVAWAPHETRLPKNHRYRAHSWKPGATRGPL